MPRKPIYIPPPAGSIHELHWLTRLIFIVGVGAFVALVVNALLEAFA